jgi:hypothetical protein
MALGTLEMAWRADSDAPWSLDEEAEYCIGAMADSMGTYMRGTTIRDAQWSNVLLADVTYAIERIMGGDMASAIATLRWTRRT